MDILHKLLSGFVYVIRRALSERFGYKVCPECGCLNMLAAWYCISCRERLRLEPAEDVFALLINPRYRSWHKHRHGGLRLRELFFALRKPVRG